MFTVTEEDRDAHRAMTLAMLKARVKQPKMTMAFLKTQLAHPEWFSAEAETYPAPVSRNFAGLKVMIENPVGSTRSGIGSDGKKWSVTMRNAYGYLARTKGSANDGDELDVFLGPESNPRDVYIINQNHVGGVQDGLFDEQKVMLGWKSAAAAKTAYLLNYSSPKFFRSLTIIPMASFRKMITGAEPGSVHWQNKQRRELEAVAMFSADDENWPAKDRFERRLKTARIVPPPGMSMEEARKSVENGHGSIYGSCGHRYQCCRCAHEPPRVYETEPCPKCQGIDPMKEIDTAVQKLFRKSA